jgi:Domain of unknown function (DUF1840)
MYKFKSRAAPDLIMLEPNGRQIVSIVGKATDGVGTQGILLPSEMPAAIAALQDAIAQDEQKRAQMVKEAQEAGEAEPKFEGVSLRQRALPMIEMLRRCQKAGKEVVWGV